MPGGTTRNIAAITDDQHQTMTMHGVWAVVECKSVIIPPKASAGQRESLCGRMGGPSCWRALRTRCKKRIPTTTANLAKRQRERPICLLVPGVSRSFCQHLAFFRIWLSRRYLILSTVLVSLSSTDLDTERSIITRYCCPRLLQPEDVEWYLNEHDIPSLHRALR